MPGLRAERPAPVCLAAEAMRCRFEFMLFGADPAALRAAGEEGLSEIRAWDRRLNVYSPASELSRINREAGRHPVTVSAPVFELLALARDVSARTGGAFDPALGPVVRLWREAARSGRLPSPNSIASARAACGVKHALLDPRARTVAFETPDIEINLNAIAKGHALDQAALLLREAGVGTFLLQGGTSSVLASGTPPGGDGWILGIAAPRRPTRVCHRVALRDAALGVSSQSLQEVGVEGRRIGHVLSPLTGAPVEASGGAAVIAPSAAAADALSTALFIAGTGSADWLLPEEQGLMLPGEAPGAGVELISPIMTAIADR